ncbi:hypothetical protein BH09BAC6_BH09BAC6_25210 [soil metagenome]|jgi:hypothetical protein
MRQTRIQRPAILLLCLGLLLVTSSLMIGHLLTLSDFVRGSLVGVGIGLELMAVIILKKRQVRG